MRCSRCRPEADRLGTIQVAASLGNMGDSARAHDPHAHALRGPATDRHATRHRPGVRPRLQRRRPRSPAGTEAQARRSRSAPRWRPRHRTPARTRPKRRRTTCSPARRRRGERTGAKNPRPRARPSLDRWSRSTGLPGSSRRRSAGRCDSMRCSSTASSSAATDRARRTSGSARRSACSTPRVRARREPTRRTRRHCPDRRECRTRRSASAPRRDPASCPRHRCVRNSAHDTRCAGEAAVGSMAPHIRTPSCAAP